MVDSRMKGVEKVKTAIYGMLVGESRNIKLDILGMEVLIFRMYLSKISSSRELVYWTKYNKEKSILTVMRMQ